MEQITNLLSNCDKAQYSDNIYIYKINDTIEKYDITSPLANLNYIDFSIYKLTKNNEQIKFKLMDYVALIADDTYCCVTIAKSEYCRDENSVFIRSSKYMTLFKITASKKRNIYCYISSNINNIYIAKLSYINAIGIKNILLGKIKSDMSTNMNTNTEITNLHEINLHEINLHEKTMQQYIPKKWGYIWSIGVTLCIILGMRHFLFNR